MRLIRLPALLAVVVINTSVGAQAIGRGVSVGGRGVAQGAAAGRGGSCQSNPWAALGIAKLKCESCASEGRVFTFDAEPIVESILANSSLRAGDVVLAIDTRPITTREGGALFSALSTGPHTLTVRRSGDRTDVTFQVPSNCAPGEVHISAERIEVGQGRTTMSKAMLSFQPGPPTVIQGRGGANAAAMAQLNDAAAAMAAEVRSLQVARANDADLQRALARLEAQARQLQQAAAAARAVADANALGAAVGGRGGRGVPSAASRPVSVSAGTVVRGGGGARGGRAGGGGALAEAGPVFERARYGITLNCRQSCTRASTAAGASEFFRALPRIEAVASGSVAAGVDLRAGDQLVAVNGMRITASVTLGSVLRIDPGTAEFSRVWAAGTETIKLTVLRDAKEIEVTLKP